MNQNQVELAINLFKEAHTNDRYGKHDYFQYHIEGVVSIVKHKFFPDASTDYRNKLLIVAYGHDSLEDHPDVIQEDLLERLFTSEVKDAIVAISKVSGESTDEYLQRVMKNELARKVKIADSTFNGFNCILENQFKRARKYESNVKYLEDNV